MKEKINKTFYFINTYDVKSSWASTLCIIIAVILFGAIVYVGIIYALGK